MIRSTIKEKAKFDINHTKILKIQNTHLFFNPITEKLLKKRHPMRSVPFSFLEVYTIIKLLHEQSYIICH